MQQHQHHYIDARRPRLMDSSNKTTRYDDFYAKLERIRLTAAASSSKQCSQRSATEILDESKAFFVKSQEVLRNRQTLRNHRGTNDQQRMTPPFRIAHPHRSPYYDDDHEQCRLNSFDLPVRSTTPPLSTSAPTNLSDIGAFESVSLLSLSDQTTLDSANSSTPIQRTVIPATSLTVIERNARIIKWLFQLNKANASLSSFQEVP